MTSRVGIRFAAEAVAIVAAAVVAGPVLHLVWWQVGLAVFAVLGIGILVESSLGAPASPPVVEPAPQPPAVEERPHVRVLQERPVAPPAPEPEPLRLPEPEPEPEPEPVAVAVAAPPTRVSGPPYNVWELERALDESGNTNDEQTFLLHYLRDYAGPDGALPSDFDDLVRESFPSLL